MTMAIRSCKHFPAVGRTVLTKILDAHGAKPYLRAMPKTPYSAKELAEFKELLLQKKARLIQEIQGKQAELTSTEKEEVGDLADLATELIERELNMSLSESDRARLEEIDAALERIKNKTYGICVDTGEVISKARLKAVPEALRTLAAQEAYDRAQKKRKAVSRIPDFD